MEIVLTTVGGYPRTGSKPEQRYLRRTYDLWEKGERTDKDLKEAMQKMTREAIEEQIKAGIELVTDGQIFWYDPVSHFLRNSENVEINGLLRFFDTNFYFRQPIICSKIKITAALVLDEFLFAKQISARPVKPVLTGPYTLAKLSIIRDRNYNVGSLTEDICENISKELKRLSENGAQIVQIDEPAILYNPDDFQILFNSVKYLKSSNPNLKLVVYFYFGNISGLFDKILTLPADVIGFDLTYDGEEVINKIIKSKTEKDLSLGVVNGRNTLMEEPQKIASTIRKISDSVRSSTIYLNPSCNLEYLPRDYAYKKLLLLSETKKMIA